MIEASTGNYAAAQAAKLAKADVIAVYPITPQTTISEYVASMVQKGEMNAEFLLMESEHSAMSALIGASTIGARTFTATSSHGLALMHEMLMWAVGARTPIVMPVAARAIGGPWNIWGDHQDAISERDTGWLQFFCENNQEVLDTILMAYRVAEDRKVMLPAMVVEDGFVLSHTVERIDIPDQEEVDAYLPKYSPEFLADTKNPMRFGGLVTPDLWTEFRYRIAESHEASREKLKAAEKDFEKVFGRSYGSPVETYRCEDADAVLIAAGAVAGTAKEVADQLREEGKKVGVARIRVFRPFPSEEIRKLVSSVPSVGVLDKSYTFGDGGAMFNEVRSAAGTLDIGSYIAGLGGRDVPPKVLIKIFNNILEKSRGTVWADLKGGDFDD